MNIISGSSDIFILHGIERTGVNMRQAQKYFMLNKKADFLEGSMENMKMSSLGLCQIDKTKKGYFFSSVLDTLEKASTWQKMEITYLIKSNTAILIRFYVSETEWIVTDAGQITIDQLLRKQNICAEDKEKYFVPFQVLVTEDVEELLLYQAIGRYGWFEIVFFPTINGEAAISKIKVIFPKNTWMNYLPDIYQEDEQGCSFVERYLSIFQSLYDGVTAEISRISEYFDIDCVNGKFLIWLSEWLAIEDSFLWKQEQLKYILNHAMELYQKRGTVFYLKEIIKIYIDREPYIVEHHQIQPYMTEQKKAEILTRLYGESSYIFTIIIKTEHKMTRAELRVIERLTENAKPAHMESNIIILEPYIFLGWHSYLGINSILSDYSALVLDGQASIPFIRLTDE